MEENIIDQKIIAIREVLCHVAGFPFRKKEAMSPLDYRAVELLTSDLWEYKSRNSRLETYTQLFAIYDEREVPEYVHRLGHIMTCRYGAVPGLDTLRRAVEEAEPHPIETFGEKLTGKEGGARINAVVVVGSLMTGWLVVLLSMLGGL